MCTPDVAGGVSTTSPFALDWSHPFPFTVQPFNAIRTDARIHSDRLESPSNRVLTSSYPTDLEPTHSQTTSHNPTHQDELLRSSQHVGVEAQSEDALLTPVRINFQPGNVSTPDGYLTDSGQAYNDAQGFGWITQASVGTGTSEPLDISPNARDRDKVSDQALDTLLHMQFPTQLNNAIAVKTPAAWEYVLPNGRYQVSVSVGDANGATDSSHQINIEGTTAIAAFQPTMAQPFQQKTVEVDVSDGKLTVDAIGGINTKINFVEIVAVEPVSNAEPIYTWSTAAPSPIGRTEAAGTVVGGKIYVFGGYSGNFTPINRADVYDPATNSWQQLANMPKGLTHTGIANDQNNIYLAGGYVSTPSGGQTFATRDVWKYNISSNTWTALPPLPAARGAGGLELMNGKLHFFGGNDSSRLDKGDHWLLNLTNGTSWNRRATLPNSRSHIADATIDGKIYAIGGQKGYNNNSITQTSVHSWDPTTNQWTAVTNLPQALSHMGGATFVMNGKITIMAGEIAHTKTIDDIISYDPLTGLWSTIAELPITAHSGIGGSINGNLYYTTGAPNFKTTTYVGSPVIS